MENIDGFVDRTGFPVMLNQSHEEGFSAPDVSIANKAENLVDGVEVTGLCKLVDERRVRWVVVSETHFLVLVEERKSFLWVFDFFEIGEKWHFLPWLPGEFVSWFMAAGFLCGFLRSRCVVMALGRDALIVD